MNAAGQRLVTALEQSGAVMLDQHKQKIIEACDGIADDWLDRVVVAIANNLPSGGVKNIEWGPIKGAVLASESEIDDATNVQIEKIFTAVDNALKGAATPPASSA